MADDDAARDRPVPALTLAVQACAAALAALAAPAPAAVPARTPDPPPLEIVLADLDALLALVYALSTKLALAATSYPASVPLLHDLAQHAPALAHAARLIHPSVYGATLAKDARNRVGDVIDALRALVQTLLDSAVRGPSGNEHLVRTGALHDRITHARGPSGIPRDNRAAVCLSWKSDKDSLEDNFQEIARMISDAESDDPTPDVDDGWDELGLDHPTRLGKHELARAKNVHQLLRLTTLLHKRVLSDLLADPSPAPVLAFDALLAQSNRLLSTSDDLVAALYAPQDPAHVRKEILGLANIVASLQTQLPVFLPATDQLTRQMDALSLDSTSPAAMPISPSKKRADKKWFDTCVHQILRLCTTMSEPSSQSDDPSTAT